jgi:hypothetical protein
MILPCRVSVGFSQWYLSYPHFGDGNFLFPSGNASSDKQFVQSESGIIVAYSDFERHNIPVAVTISSQ